MGDKTQRASFVEYVSEVFPRQHHSSQLTSSSSTLTSVQRDLSVRSEQPHKASAGQAQYKYTGTGLTCLTHINISHRRNFANTEP